MKKIIKSYHIQGEKGGYIEAIFSDGKKIKADTFAGVDGILEGLTVDELFEKYGEGERMDFEDTDISDEIIKEELLIDYLKKDEIIISNKDKITLAELKTKTNQIISKLEENNDKFKELNNDDLSLKEYKIFWGRLFADKMNLQHKLQRLQEKELILDE